MIGASTSFANTQKRNEEKAAGLVMGKVLAAIDFKSSQFSLNFFEGAFFKKNKDTKSSLRIDSMHADASIKFKNDVIIDTQDFSKEMSAEKKQKNQEWQPKISLLSKDLSVLSALDADSNDKLKLTIFFKKANDKADSGLKILVGNSYNQELINMNLVSINVILITDPNSTAMNVRGSCLARKKIAGQMQDIPQCTFSGVVDSENDTYNINVNFGDKKQATQKLN